MKRIYTYAFSVILFITSCVDRRPTNEKADASALPETICRVDDVPQLKVAVLIYDGVEVVDMSGPIDAFTKANIFTNNHYCIYTVAVSDSVVHSESATLAIIPKYTIYNCPEPDILVVPGCPPSVVHKLLQDTSFFNTALKWVKQTGDDKSRIVMSVCTGGLLLCKSGLLDGKKATTHYLALQNLRDSCKSTIVESGVRYVQDGNIITTAGITSGIDGALYLVSKLDGYAAADSTAQVMVYDWSDSIPKAHGKSIAGTQWR